MNTSAPFYNINVQENKKYVYVISYYTPSSDFNINHLMNTDISIFEIDEWNDLLSKSEMFHTWVNILNSESDIDCINKNPDMKRATYYLYHNCDYCK